MQQQQQAFPIYSGNFQSHHPRPQQQPLPPPQQFTNNPYRPSPVLPQTNYSTQQQQQQQPSRKIYACKEQGCTEYFDQPTALRHHQKAAHGGNEEIQAKIAGQNKPYLCPFPECGKSFTQYGNLKTHSRKHTGERPYHCKYEGCDKAFTQLGNLKTHEKIHWPVKPFMCTYPGCGKGFTQRGNLKTHQTKVHQIAPQ